MLTEAEKLEILRERGLNPSEWQVTQPEPAQPAALPQAAQPTSSLLGTIGRAGGRSLVPSLGAGIGGAGGYALGLALAPETGGLSLAIPIVSSLIGGGLGSIGAEKAQEATLGAVAPRFKAELDQQQAIDAAQHPIAQAAGGILGSLPTFEFNPMASARGLKAAYSLARGGLSEVEQVAARKAAASVGSQVGLGAATGVVNPLLEGRAPTWQDVGMGAGQAALLGRHRGYLGEIPGLGFMRHPVPPAIGTGMYQEPIGPVGPAETPLGPLTPLPLRINNELGLGNVPPNAADQQALLAAAQKLPAPRSRTFYGDQLGNVSLGDFGQHEVPSSGEVITGQAPPSGKLEARAEVPILGAGPSLDSLQRQLDDVRALASDSRLPVSKRVEAQMAVDEIQRKIDAVSPHLVPSVSVPRGQGREPIGAGYAGTYPPTAMQLGTFERRQGPPAQRSPMPVEPGLKYNVVPPEQLQAEFPLRKSSASPENIPATQAYAATHPVPAPVRDLPEHPGVQQRPDVPKKQEEVRSQKGPEAGSGSGLRPGKEEAVVAPEPGAIKKLAASVQLSGSQEPVISATGEGHAGVNDRLNAILARQGADPNIKLQEAVRTAEELTPGELLSHPVNADILAATEKIAERHNVTLKATDEQIITPEQKVAAGAADLKQRLARYNGSLASVDTGLHEIAHVFLDDLRSSSSPEERALYDRGVMALGGDEEALTQAVGLRSADLLRSRIEGNVLTRFKAWAKDFWSHVKEKFGQGNEKDLTNLLARRMVDGEMVARGERPALQGPTLRFQEARQKEEARTGEASSTLRAHDLTLPVIRPVMENVRRIPLFGEHLYKAFHNFYDVRNEMLGKYRNQVAQELNRIDPWHQQVRNAVTRKPLTPNADAIAERLFAERENPNYTPTTELKPEVERAYLKIKELLRTAADEANLRGIKVMDGDDFREIKASNRYVPHMIGEAASAIMTGQQGGASFNALRKSYVDWLMKGGLQGAAKGLSKGEALAAWESRLRGVSGQTEESPSSRSSFGALEKAQGFGLPPEMRETRLNSLLSRYFDRYAEKIAWHELVEKRTPENAVTRALLDETDQFGSKEQNATHLPTGEELVNVKGQQPIKHAVKDMLRNYDRADRAVEAFNRVVKSSMMQTLTGFADFTGGLANAAQHLQLKDYVTILPSAVRDMAKGIQAGLRWNVVQEHAARLQSGSIEGGGNLPMGSRLDNMVKAANAVADGIYKITGRDAFEKWGRGLLMNLGMLKTEATIGRIRSGKPTPADIKWMDTFMERGKWEGLLKDGGDGITTELQERIAAKFVESVQGTYDARGLPSWALSGQLSPFFALARWNLEKANNFTKYVINPMRTGDFAPFLKMTMGAAVAGEAVHLFRQMVTARKPQDADWKEIMAAGGQGLDYRLLASMAYSGYSGALADILKQAYDIGHGNQAQGFRFPVVSAITGFANRGSQFAQALEEGENPIALLPQLALTIAKDNIQMARALTRYASEDEQQDVERANALRDLKVFRQQAGIPVPPAIGQQANPFLNPLKKNFQRATDLSAAGQLAPQLFQQAIQRAAGDPERLRSLLRNYAAPSSDVMPSAIRTPLQFSQYVKWLEATQGGPAAQAAQQQYFQKSMLDQVKHSLVPQL